MHFPTSLQIVTLLLATFTVAATTTTPTTATSTTSTTKSLTTKTIIKSSSTTTTCQPAATTFCCASAAGPQPTLGDYKCNPASTFPCPANNPLPACCNLQIHDVHLDSSGQGVIGNTYAAKWTCNAPA